MCNLYNLIIDQQAIRDFIDITRFREGNLPASISFNPTAKDRSLAAGSKMANASLLCAHGVCPHLKCISTASRTRV
jgi:putative SOS response-associated peptidase YedK